MDWETGLRQLFSQYLDILTGKTPYWDTPEYKYTSASMDKSVRDMMSQAIRTGQEQGLTGGALYKYLQDIMAQGFAQKGVSGQNIMSGIANKAIGLGTQGAERDLARWQAMLQAYIARKNRKSQERIARSQQQTGVFTSMAGGGGGGCCFIFIEGEGELTEHVRKFRDTHYGKESDISKGYRKMASWLVPIMRKNKFVKQLVKCLMTRPLSWYAKYYGGIRSWFLYPFAFFWTKTWAIYGKY